MIFTTLNGTRICQVDKTTGSDEELVIAIQKATTELGSQNVMPIATQAGALDAEHILDHAKYYYFADVDSYKT